MLLTSFYTDKTETLHTGAHKILYYITTYGRNLLIVNFVYLLCTKYNELNILLCHDEENINYRVWYE